MHDSTRETIDIDDLNEATCNYVDTAVDSRGLALMTLKTRLYLCISISGTAHMYECVWPYVLAC